MNRRVIFGVIFVLAFLSGLAYLWLSNQSLPLNTLQINQQRFNLKVATTTEDQIKGLAGTTNLANNQGMLFPLDGGPTSFWMKGMLIDIDIIWIKDYKVAGINHQVPAPDPSTPDNQLPSYPSPVTNPQAVLEIAAGQAKAQNISIGDSVRWNIGE